MIFFSFWEGPKLSLYEQLCIKSFEQFGHEIKLYSYSAAISGFEGKLYDAEIIAPKAVFREFKSITSFSNYFRYLALDGNESGGTWVDLDMLCLSGSWPESDYLMGFEKHDRLNNAVLRIPTRTTMLSSLISGARSDEGKKFGSTGPFLLTKVWKASKKEFEVQPINLFYGVGHWEIEMLIDPLLREATENRLSKSLAVHLYNELIVRAAIPKNILPPVGSFLYDKFKAIMPELTSVPVLGEDWLIGWRRNFRERKIANFMGRILGPIRFIAKNMLRLR